MSKGLLDAPKLRPVQIFWQNKLLPNPILNYSEQLLLSKEKL